MVNYNGNGDVVKNDKNIFIYKNDSIEHHIKKEQQLNADIYKTLFEKCGFNVVPTLKEANIAFVLRQHNEYQGNALVENIYRENEKREINGEQRVDWFSEGYNGLKELSKKYCSEEKKEEMRLNSDLRYKSVDHIKQTYIRELKEIN